MNYHFAAVGRVFLYTTILVAFLMNLNKIYIEKSRTYPPSSV